MEYQQEQSSSFAAKSKFCFIAGKTLSTSLGEIMSGSHNLDPQCLHSCLTCYDGCINKEVTRHSMITCTVWNSLTREQKEEKVSCVKHLFAADNHKLTNCNKHIGACKNVIKLILTITRYQVKCTFLLRP